MARYTVTVVQPSGRLTRLLIVLSPEQLCSDLVDKIESRISSLNPAASYGTFTLRLNTADGPILDPEDLLLDALPDAIDVVFAVIDDLPAADAAFQDHASMPSGGLPKTDTTVGSLKVRVITPELARSHLNVNDIPLISGTITSNTTLKELRRQVEQHLSLQASSQPEDNHHVHCNCSFARQIDAHASLDTDNMLVDAAAPNNVIVVYGYNEVISVAVDEKTQEAVKRAVHLHLPAEAAQAQLFTLGGARQLALDSNPHYLRLPVVALCASARHRADMCSSADEESSGEASSSFLPRCRFMVDMHTSEMPIHVTTHNRDVTLEAIGLDECAVDGVLNIYAVKRVAPESVIDFAVKAEGQREIYCQSPAWKHPMGQSERGLANFLSSLRVFVGLVQPMKMEEAEQDAVLHLLMLLTRFPPAVRAVQILMRGETTQPSERAAIIQSVHEVLKDIVPPRVVNNNTTRLLEGSRLLFGLILEKAKHLQRTMQSREELRFPYMDSYTIYELRNLITMESVVTPIQTTTGLVDQGFFNAFKAGGPLRWKNGNNNEMATTSDSSLLRACLLFGGIKSQVLSFDIDTIVSSSRYADGGDVTKVLSPTELSDLQYLSGLCSRNHLGVIHPSSLPSTDPPVLTLDRAGLLAVYVGRQACGQAGRDINMFRPTSTVVEEAVDVSIITQLLIPILGRYAADGTAVFESFGDRTRQIKEPNEIIMLCVDASSSMNWRCGFDDIEENEDAGGSSDIADCSVLEAETDIENAGFDRPALDELKDYLSKHESFKDMLAIVHGGDGEFNRSSNALKVLEILRTLLQQQIAAGKTELDRASRAYHNRQARTNIERGLEILKNRKIRLARYEDALVAFLLYRAENRVLDQMLTWTVGDDVPDVPRTSPDSHTVAGLEFVIPTDYLCPISIELMEDPVSTTDGFTYERRSIERWLQSHETSPCTNLVLQATDLMPNFGTKSAIAEWVAGNDITSNHPSTSRGHMSLCFQSPLGSIDATIPASITVGDLYQKAFRATKGRYSSFSLQHNNTILIPSEELASLYLTEASIIVVTPMEPVSRTAAPSNSDAEELCLVKVYMNDHKKVMFSYWEPRTNLKTLASVIFRYYRHRVTIYRRIAVSCPLTVWTDMRHLGDGQFQGSPEDHWQNLSRFFNAKHATGRLVDEALYEEDDDVPDRIAVDRAGAVPVPLVLKLRLSRTSSRTKRKPLSRMDVLKQMFDAFINRLLAYGYPSHLGLVTFRTTASLTQNITHAIENFRHELNSIEASGDTTLWDALSLARDSLTQYATKYPKARLRIICLSDGEDNKSKQVVHEVAAALVHDRITVDSFCLGTADMSELQAVSYLTGGYKFHPHQLEHAMAICELEPVLSLSERPDIILPPFGRGASGSLDRLYHAISEVDEDVVTRDTFPQRREHPLMSESYVELGNLANVSRFSMANRSDLSMRLARIHNEIRNSAAKVHPHYDIYVCESNMAMWKIVMQGPPGSAYATGTFLLYLEMGEDYPMFPPKGRFVTPVYHPNINRHGRICHSIFDRNWTVDTTSKDIIDTIYSLLLVPEFSDPINTVVTLDFHWDEVQFKEEAGLHIEMHASKNRMQWKSEILG
ncbi:uncharacterized protein N0V89_005453 [Didymosphaeria variabile]|uniref:peptidylprolyl isomerase n=1 Tax=Didymosphaeria variabile TaxID=1932322 RepID=A0A9W9CBR3_9PLEO|nr:uncharacterized protein N0V89_005453 [Didymosphaeria variabile]KAJ4353723.1 hypothetical protein N0V89_005453 [Didymosphaeria variabile]